MNEEANEILTAFWHKINAARPKEVLGWLNPDTVEVDGRTYRALYEMQIASDPERDVPYGTGFRAELHSRDDGHIFWTDVKLEPGAYERGYAQGAAETLCKPS